jgi:hypothetical protein
MEIGLPEALAWTVVVGAGLLAGLTRSLSPETLGKLAGGIAFGVAPLHVCRTKVFSRWVWCAPTWGSRRCSSGVPSWGRWPLRPSQARSNAARASCPLLRGRSRRV